MDDANLTPRTLAKEADTTEATVSGWLNDVVQAEHAKGALACRMARATGVRVEWLLLAELPKRADALVTANDPRKDDVAGLRIVVEMIAEALTATTPGATELLAARVALLGPAVLGLPPVAQLLETVRAQHPHQTRTPARPR